MILEAQLAKICGVSVHTLSNIETVEASSWLETSIFHTRS